MFKARLIKVEKTYCYSHALSTCFLAGGTVWGGCGVLKRRGLVSSKSLGAGLEEDSPALVQIPLSLPPVTMN